MTLDTSGVSLEGLYSLQNVLQGSHFERLRVKCPFFEPSLEQGICQLLASFRWSTISSLVLFGENIDEWIQLWMASRNLRIMNDSGLGPRLLSLEMKGIKRAPPQTLSHTSVLFIHQVAYSSPLVDLYFENVKLERMKDWEVIAEGLDYSVLETVYYSGKKLCKPIALGDILALVDRETRR